MKKSVLRFGIAMMLCAFSFGTLFSQDAEEVDHSYKPLTLKLNESGSKYIRFITWHQMWLTSNNLSSDANVQFATSIRRSRLLAFAQVSPRFLILTHFGLNGLTQGNITSLGNNGNGAQLFLHDAWTEFKLTDAVYIGAGLHYWKGMTRLGNQSTLNMMTMDNSRPFAHWHSLGITDQFARHLGIYAKGGFGKFKYRLAINNPIRPSNSLGAGAHLGDLESTITYTGNEVQKDGENVGNTLFEGYFNYELWDAESNKLPYFVGSYLGAKKVFNIGAGFFAHPNGMYDSSTNEHQAATHFAVDAFLDMPVGQGGCLNAYASVMSYNYGENFVSRWAGTGTVIYGQVGYLIPGTKIMPYVSMQSASYDGMSESVSELNIGANYFILGHNAKITLEYHQITNDIREAAITDFQDNNVLSQIRVQAHIFL